VAQRIKGQEVEVIILNGSQALTNITTVKDFDFTFQLEVLSEGYLGMTTNLRDSYYKGVAGKMTLHLESGAVFDFVRSAIDKARRRTPGLRINVKATLNFPSGERRRVMINDCEFGEFPFTVGGREQYVSVTVNYEAPDATILGS